MKRDGRTEREARGEGLDLAPEIVLAGDVEEEARNAAAGQREGTEERRLVLDAVEAPDVEKPHRPVPVADRARQEAACLDAERDELGLEARRGG